MGKRQLSIVVVAIAAICGCQSGKPRAAANDAAIAKAPAPALGPPWRPGYERPPIIDAHTHIAASGLPRLAKIMKGSNIALVVNVSGGSTRTELENSIEMQRRLPAMVHFYNPDWRAAHSEGFGARAAAGLEVAVKKAGFKGLKIEKLLGLGLADKHGERIPVDWPELDPLWRKAGELGVPVAIHTGDPKAFWQPPTPDNERYAELSVHPAWSFADPVFPSRETLLAERNRVIARHPDTTFICVHFGNNPEDLAYVAALLEGHANVVIDIAARLGEIGRHPADEVRAFFIKYQKRILFGTDLGVSGRGLMLGSTGAEPQTMAEVAPFYRAHFRFFEGKERGIPHPTPIQGDWTIDAINLPDEVLDRLYRKNAEDLLGLRRRAQGPAPGPARAGQQR